MKKLLRIVLALMLSLSIFCSYVMAADSVSFVGKESNKLDSYDFPVKGGTYEWESFTSHREMTEACQIPQDTLKNMSTAGLVESVLNYPLYGDMLAYSNLQDGVEALSNQFNGLAELLTRDDAGKELLSVYKNNINVLEVKSLSTSLQKGNYALKLAYLETILSQDKILSSLTQAEKEDLEKESIKKDTEKKSQNDVFKFTLDTSDTINKTISIMASIGYVYTPNGTPVEVIVDRTEMSSSEMVAADTYVAVYYPGAVKLASATNKYNCHSYAWYSRSTSNIRWMNDPSAYMTDGSYTYLGTTPPSVIVSYPRMYYPGEHSAWMTSSTGSTYSKITCTSKWGSLPLMSHKANYCPYNYSIIEFYN